MNHILFQKLFRGICRTRFNLNAITRFYHLKGMMDLSILNWDEIDETLNKINNTFDNERELD